MARHVVERCGDRLEVDPGAGLSDDEVQRRLAQYGPNELATEPPPSVWVVARGQLSNPMNIMLLIVSVASFVIGQAATGLFVLGLVTFNVVMGSNQELKARASVEALAQLQVPHARVRRSASVQEIDSTQLVPGDVVLLEAGDLVPADGRLVTSATLEVQEAALTGESAPVPKDTNPIAGDDVALGDRTDMVFQTTQVTRGSASAIVTATGQSTQMGRIADMVTATKRSRSPLQRELDGLTKVFGVLAWSAVAVIAIVGIVRGQDTGHAAAAVHLDGDRVHPGRTPHVRAGDVVVGSATPGRVEGGRQDADRRGDARRHDRHQQRQDRHADDERDDGDDDAGRRRLVQDRRRRATRRPARSWARPAANRPTSEGWPWVSASARMPPSADDGSIIGDPTEAALVVLAAKMGVDAEQTRQALPRRAEVPFDSEYKFMATFHDRPSSSPAGSSRNRTSSTVKGAPGRRDRALRPCAVARRSDRRSTRSATRSWPRTSSSPSAGCGCSRSQRVTWTTPR